MQSMEHTQIMAVFDMICERLHAFEHIETIINRLDNIERAVTSCHEHLKYKERCKIGYLEPHVFGWPKDWKVLMKPEYIGKTNSPSHYCAILLYDDAGDKLTQEQLESYTDNSFVLLVSSFLLYESTNYGLFLRASKDYSVDEWIDIYKTLCASVQYDIFNDGGGVEIHPIGGWPAEVFSFFRYRDTMPRHYQISYISKLVIPGHMMIKYFENHELRYEKVVEWIKSLGF